MFLLKLISQKGQYFLPFDEFYSEPKDPLFEKYKDHPEIRNKDHPRYLEYLSRTFKEFSTILDFEEKNFSLFIKLLNIGIALFINDVEELENTAQKKSPRAPVAPTTPIRKKILNGYSLKTIYTYILHLRENGADSDKAFHAAAKHFGIDPSELGHAFAKSKKAKKQKAPA